MKWQYFEPKFEFLKELKILDSAWNGHFNFAYDLTANLKPDLIVELGTHYGHSFFSFCQAVKDKKLKTKLSAIDTWQGDKHSGIYGTEVLEKVKQIKEKYYKKQNIKLLQKTFDKAKKDFSDESIDILHIDGLHTYEAVKHDFYNWKRKLKKNSVVLFHDISVKKDDFGVYKLWSELKKEFNNYLEFHHSNGLGVIFFDKNHYQKNIKNIKEILPHYYQTKAQLLYSQTELKKIYTNNKIQLNTINHLNQTIHKVNFQLNKLDCFNKNQGEKYEKKLKERNKVIKDQHREIVELINRINNLEASIFFKFKKIYSGIKFLLFHPDKFFQKYINNPQNYKKSNDPIYKKWIGQNENWKIKQIKKQIKKLKTKPKFSIIIPIYNVENRFLFYCLRSVFNQYYKNWQLCIYDDGSKNKAKYFLKILALLSFGKIKVKLGKTNQGIAKASNQAIKMATGDFIVLLDNDDMLSPNALYEVAKTINKNPKAKFIYSDEDKVDENNFRYNPYFKPDWSIDLFLSSMYTCHLAIFSKKIIDQIKGFREGFEGSQDYDLVLRFIDKINQKNILHIPKILYHWRAVEKSSTAHSIESKSYAIASAKKALQEYAKRNKIKAKVLDGPAPSFYRFKRKILEKKLVSIIIPFKDEVEILKSCINSIKKKTDYPNYEIILINNNSQEKQTFDYLKKIKDKSKIKIINYNKKFNYSKINNFASQKAKGEYLLFLNNDMEVINKKWLTNMVEHIQRKQVGAVGAKLLYPNNTIQHAGVIIGIGGVAGHAHKTLKKDQYGYFCRACLIQNFSACTAACLMVKKDVFEQVKGFEEKLRVAFNDVDLCLKIRKKGYLIVYTPYAKLYHYESLSRGNDAMSKDKKRRKEMQKEIEFMQKKWKKTLKKDPYYNPNLSNKYENFRIKLKHE
ncbi:MAG: glycosyltransferase [Candidatus Moranbacteria bacterium]|nr:glycosyltransferase [Candidatus Moranbacteria bacterium]